MEGVDCRRWPSWKNLKRRLRWKRINILGFCGSSKWDRDPNAGEQPLMFAGDQSPAAWDTMIPGCQILAGDGGATMNLATALAAERRQVNVGSTEWMPLKSIVRLLDGRDVKVAAHDGGGGGIGTLCCLCTERKKGAALIPCGHTYCRVCSRAMWSKQKACPLCNRSIMDILEMF